MSSSPLLISTLYKEMKMWVLSFEKYQQKRYKSLQTSFPTFLNKKWVSKMPRHDIQSIFQQYITPSTLFKSSFPAFWTCVQSIVSLIIEGGVCYVLLVYVFPANIWLLFCIQSVWSDIVFWKQIKLIPKMHISNRYLEQKCCINNSWILSVFCANKLYQFLLFFISELNQTISYNFPLLPWRRGF